MTDKERILSIIISTVILKKDELPVMKFSQNKSYSKGNILVALTSFDAKWKISLFDHYDKEKNCVVVKDLVSNRLCNYFNEAFIEIPRDWFSEYTFLTGKKYKIYNICQNLENRIHSLTFDDINETFTLKDRLPFHEEPYSQITISTKLPLKETKKQLEEGNWIKL